MLSIKLRCLTCQRRLLRSHTLGCLSRRSLTRLSIALRFFAQCSLTLGGLARRSLERRSLSRRGVSLRFVKHRSLVLRGLARRLLARRSLT